MRVCMGAADLTFFVERRNSTLTAQGICRPQGETNNRLERPQTLTEVGRPCVLLRTSPSSQMS